jgi:hypothetical protein
VDVVEVAQGRPTVSDWIDSLATTLVLCNNMDEGEREIRQAYAEHCRSVDTDNLAVKIAEVCYPEIPGITDSDGVMFARESVRQCVSNILAPLLARNAAMEAVLRECRLHVSYSRAPKSDVEFLLSRIDKLTAKGAGP